MKMRTHTTVQFGIRANSALAGLEGTGAKRGNCVAGIVPVGTRTRQPSPGLNAANQNSVNSGAK